MTTRNTQTYCPKNSTMMALPGEATRPSRNRSEAALPIAMIKHAMAPSPNDSQHMDAPRDIRVIRLSHASANRMIGLRYAVLRPPRTCAAAPVTPKTRSQQRSKQCAASGNWIEICRACS